jgi:hypothetical protein
VDPGSDFDIVYAAGKRERRCGRYKARGKKKGGKRWEREGRQCKGEREENGNGREVKKKEEGRGETGK